MSGSRKFPRIAEVRAWLQTSDLPGGASFPPRNSVEAAEGTSIHGMGTWLDGIPTPICNPMSVYDQYSALEASPRPRGA